MKAIKPVSTLIKPQQARAIELRGLRTHNLKSIDLDLPLRRSFLSFRAFFFSFLSRRRLSSSEDDTLEEDGERARFDFFDFLCPGDLLNPYEINKYIG